MSAHLLTCINCSLPIFVDNSIPPSSCLLLLSLLCFCCPSWHSNFTHKLHLRWGSKDYSATVEDAGRHAGWSKCRPQDSMRGVGWSQIQAVETRIGREGKCASQQCESGAGRWREARAPLAVS